MDEQKIAELGGYDEWWPSTPAGICYIIGMLLLLYSLIYSIAVDEGYYVAFVFLFISVIPFYIAATFAEIHYWECYEKGVRIQSAETRQRESSALQDSFEHALVLRERGGLTNLQNAYYIYSEAGESLQLAYTLIEIAREKERLLDYEGAIDAFEKAGQHDDAKRVRRKKLDEKKIDQTVIQGDYVDDRDTIVKDSVVNRSNIGSNSKADDLREAKALLDEGLINEKDYEQMKKEILGK